MHDGIYYAQLILSGDHNEVRVDCRPSDGIALALRADAPIYVEQHVLDNAGQVESELPPMMDIAAFLQK